MRISHEYKFVFLALPRTGSTTFRKILDAYSDIKSIHITEVSRQFPFYHHISAPELKSIFEERGWDWNGYTKFCVVRNPFDRVVSLYHHQLKVRHQTQNKPFLQNLRDFLTKDPTFEQYVQRLDPKKRLTTSLDHFICDPQTLSIELIDDVLMFENLETDIPACLEKIGIDIRSDDIPHLNASDNRQEYRQYYSDETKKTVGQLYQFEIDRFNYSF